MQQADENCAPRRRGRGPGKRSTELIEACSEILLEIQPATVRAVCYRLFTRGLLSSMSRAETNRVGRALTKARESGEIEWESIVDETRSVEGVSTWADPTQFARSLASSYRRNKWAAQPVRIEVWSEKGTVRGTLGPVLNEFEVDFRVMHGYASATAVHDVALSVAGSEQPLLVFYVGDWDPSGLHMSEVDLPGRLAEYIDLEDDLSDPPEIRRIALQASDVNSPFLPSFPAASKAGDPRHRWFVQRFGQMCWELDALSPVILRDRVKAAIEGELDRPTWERYRAAEEAERDSMERTMRRWNKLSRLEETA